MATIKDAYSEPMDASNVIANPDAQNTAQRGKKISDGLMDDYKEAANPDSTKIPSSKDLSGAVEGISMPVGKERSSGTSTVSGVIASRERTAIDKQAENIRNQYGFSAEDSKAMAGQMMNLYKQSKKQQVVEAMAALTQRQKETEAATEHANFQIEHSKLNPTSPEYINESANLYAKYAPQLAGTKYGSEAEKVLDAGRKINNQYISSQRRYVQSLPESKAAAITAEQTALLPFEQQKEARMLEMKGKESELSTQRAIDVAEAREKQKSEAFSASPQGKLTATREKVQNLNMANQLVKGIPLALIDNEEEITAGKVKWYSASRDKSGKMVADPNGEFRVFENPKDKKSPYQIIPKTDLEQARILKSGGQEKTSKQGGELDQDTAMSILSEAGGDPQKARDLARQRGYTF